MGWSDGTIADTNVHNVNKINMCCRVCLTNKEKKQLELENVYMHRKEQVQTKPLLFAMK